MIIESAPRNAPWSFVARTVFWSRDVDLDAWRAGILAGHPAYLPQSLKGMSTWNFVRFLGRKQFIEHWPQIRQAAGKRTGPVACLDLAWSYAYCGALDMPPEAMLMRLPGRRREVLNAIVHRQGISIYEVSKTTGIPYRRVHAHVQALIEQGLVRKRMDNQGPRVMAKLYTMR